MVHIYYKVFRCKFIDIALYFYNNGYTLTEFDLDRGFTLLFFADQSFVQHKVRE